MDQTIALHILFTILSSVRKTIIKAFGSILYVLYSFFNNYSLSNKEKK